MDVWDHEGNALAIYAEAGLDPADDPPGAHQLAALLGVRLRYDARKLIGGAVYQPLGSEDFVFVRPGLSPAIESVKIFHELAERHLYGARGDERHDVACDQLAYRLRMPRAAFRALVRAVGPDWRQLSLPWMATQTAGALRYLEVTGTSGVVVTPQSIRARGEEWAWPDAAELRRLVRARALPPSITRRRLTDRPGSAVLLAS